MGLVEAAEKPETPAKLAFLKDLLERAAVTSAVVYVRKPEERILVSQALGADAMSISPTMTQALRQNLYDAWRLEKFKYLIAGDTIITGVDLTRDGAQLIFWDKPKGPNEEAQLRARLARGSALWENNAEAGAYMGAASMIEQAFPEFFLGTSQ